MAATVIYQELPDATYETKGAVQVDSSSGLTVSRGLLGTRKASGGTLGVVMPDGVTLEVDDGGVMSVRGYDDTIAALIASIEALEDALDMGMAYEDGTLVVNATYEDGTLVTGRTYEDGTLS